ncbi:hypothetical protein C0Q70_11339 [Pomacea canaliculata]|uniref:Uncharacterized protein n=1 Tax=Pomacea canaliculata TaxID=400727 RepID=A0A2T7P5P0_POMCA|nr:hypothetical protein C0Q70_11339 [Pomacea canaliculata]
MGGDDGKKGGSKGQQHVQEATTRDSSPPLWLHAKSSALKTRDRISESVIRGTVPVLGGRNGFLRKGITDITSAAYSTPRRGYAGPHKNDCLPVSFSVPESPEVLQAVEVQPLNDTDEAQIPSCQAPVEPPSQENAPAKDKAKQYRPKKQQLLQKELKKRQRTGTEESPLISEYLESCITLNRNNTELVKLKI